MREEKGSITLMFCLLLTIITALICASVRSVQAASGRALAAYAAEIGLYSLFAEYDRDLLDGYDLFFLNGGYDGSSLQLEQALDKAEAAANAVIQPQITTAAANNSKITGYVLATDEGGHIFKSQVVTYMKNTLGSQALSYLINQTDFHGQNAKRQIEVRENIEAKEPLKEYDEQVELAAAEAVQEPEEELAGQPIEPPVKEAAENPIEVIRAIQQKGILGLVTENPAALSQKELGSHALITGRKLNKGMGGGRAEEDVDSVTGNILFGEYILQKCASFTRPAQPGVLDYQAEYILGGKDSDQENLTEVVNRLLLLREGANLAHLYGDPVKKGEARTLSLSLASAVGIPAAAPLVELVLLLCWAYAESLIDVKVLLAKGDVPLLKNKGEWRLSLNQLSSLPEVLGNVEDKSSQSGEGMDYRAYLRLLLYLDDKDEQVYRTMDMIEGCIRKQEGRDAFRFDTCIESMELELQIQGVYGKELRVLRSYGYDME